MARRTEFLGQSSRPNRSVFAAELVGDDLQVFGSGCLGPLPAVVAPLEAGERVVMGAAAAFSAWPPALRESVAYLSSGKRFSSGQGPANNGMQLT